MKGKTEPSETSKARKRQKGGECAVKRGMLWEGLKFWKQVVEHKKINKKEARPPPSLTVKRNSTDIQWRVQGHHTSKSWRQSQTKLNGSRSPWLLGRNLWIHSFGESHMHRQSQCLDTNTLASGWTMIFTPSITLKKLNANLREQLLVSCVGTEINYWNVAEWIRM